MTCKTQITLYAVFCSNFWHEVFSTVTALCSKGSMLRRFYVQKIFVRKVLCSEGSIFRRAYVQKVLCSESPIFRRSYVLKVLCSEKHCSKGAIFRRFYVQKVLYSDIFRRSYIQKFFVLCRKKLSVSGELQCKITNLIWAHSVKGQMSFCHGALSVVHNLPKSLCMGLQST